MIDVKLGINKKAWTILHILEGSHSHFETYRFDVAPLYNCRERGFCITVNKSPTETFCIFFAENRNSDDIVVYSWIAETSFPNPPTVNDVPQEAWENRRLFSHKEVSEAANWIQNELLMYANGW